MEIKDSENRRKFYTPSNYIEEQIRQEIEYAEREGKEVLYLEPNDYGTQLLKRIKKEREGEEVLYLEPNVYGTHPLKRIKKVGDYLIREQTKQEIEYAEREGFKKMSREYDLYLQGHLESVKKGFEFIRDNCPHLLKKIDDVDYHWQICTNHDISKRGAEEYDAYDKYFYGGNKSHQVVKEFKYAWLHHIHNNPHHWQYWILVNDDESVEILDMDYVYILEMVCDWWSFSWTKGNLYEIFSWYEERKERIQLSDQTRKMVEFILDTIKLELKKKGCLCEN